MVNLNGHEAGNGGHSQGKPKAYRDSSTRRDGDFPPIDQQLCSIRFADDTLEIVKDDCLILRAPNPAGVSTPFD